MKKLSKTEKNALREVATVMANNASIGLSDLIGKKVKLSTPTLDLVPINKIPNLVGGPKKLVVGVYSPVKGDAIGNMVVVFSKESALLFNDLLHKRELGTTKKLGEKDQKAFIKAGDILLRSYLDTLAKFLGLGTVHVPPRFISTFGESMVDFVLLGINKKIEQTLLLKTNINIDLKVGGDFVLLLAIESINTFLDLIQNKLTE